MLNAYLISRPDASRICGCVSISLIFFRDGLQKECRYAVFDLEYSLPDGSNRQKLVFIAWFANPLASFHLISRYLHFFCLCSFDSRWRQQFQLCCGFRSPDTASLKPKMVYSSSQKALETKLVGISTKIQANGLDDVEYQTVLETASAKLTK